MRTFYASAGFGLFAFCLVTFAGRYGSGWRFGRLGMPEEVVPADPVNRLLAESGRGQEITWAAVLVLAVLVAHAVRLFRLVRRGERQLEATREQLRRFYGRRD